LYFFIINIIGNQYHHLPILCLTQQKQKRDFGRVGDLDADGLVEDPGGDMVDTHLTLTTLITQHIGITTHITRIKLNSRYQILIIKNASVE
jgi:hypothetical protein